MKKKIIHAEANDVVQLLLPLLDPVGIKISQCKIDSTTTKSGSLRGDVWVSRKRYDSPGFETNIVSLIEAKHRKCLIGDRDWLDAVSHGRDKAPLHKLNFFIVTNCTSAVRFYNAHTIEEISLDGAIITALQPIEILERVQAQVDAENSHVVFKSISSKPPISERQFHKTLQTLESVYRSCGIKKDNNERVDATIAFVILKYIGEKESEQRSLDSVVKIWDDYGNERENYLADFNASRRDIFSASYGDAYKDFKALVKFPPNLKNEHYKKIYEELNKYHFHGCSFDVFGTVYEALAPQTKKKEFGEFYTRRHITGVVVRLLLRNENIPRKFRICDPACGTGGFLTEGFKALVANYEKSGHMNKSTRKRLETETFWGFDNDDASVARTQLNMFLVGDGHTHIKQIEDSLVSWDEEVGWDEETFDYVMANPPMGKYEGAAKTEDFNFTNEKRCELWFTEKIIKAVKYGCEIAIVVPDGMLEAPSREKFRVQLLHHCDVNAVVSLTRFSFAPYTKEKTYVLFLRKKQKDEVGKKQLHPVWNFIVDHDGFANSDKRYRTKWDDDLPELSDMFPGAVALAREFSSPLFNQRKLEYERFVNEREQQEDLSGMKAAFVMANEINEGNFHNLLSEFYLRPLSVESVTENEFDKSVMDIKKRLAMLVSTVNNSHE